MNMFESKPIRKLLVPTDFSAASTKALQYAALLSKSTGAKIILLHVNELPALMTNEQALATDYTIIEKDIKANLERQKHDLEKEHGVVVECHTVLGLAIPEIRDEVEREAVDLVIMGTKGAHGWKELFIGSQTSKVVERCKCPVLVLPEKAEIRIPAKIAFATNFNDHEMQALFLLVELMKPFRPEFMAIHVADSHDERLEQQKLEWFRSQVQSSISYDRFSFYELQGSSVEHALENFVNEHKVDLLSSAKRKRHFFDRLTTRSLTTDLAHHLSVPLLVFHIEAHAGTPVF